MNNIYTHDDWYGRGFARNPHPLKHRLAHTLKAARESFRNLGPHEHADGISNANDIISILER